MRYLGIDYGAKRTGLSYGDELGVATPLPAVLESEPARKAAKVAAVARERRAQALVVGYPLNMDGSVGFKAREVDAFIALLQAELPGLPVERVDERLSSHVASQHLSLKQARRLRASGKIDSAAACVVLQDFLNSKRPPTPLAGGGAEPEGE